MNAPGFRAPPAQIGKYPVLREIGSGATSRVYLARDPFAERDVAIKVLEFQKGADPEAEHMMHKAFVAEASLAGKLNHPHIVDIYDAVVEPDRSYLVMEYVPGRTLDEYASANALLPLPKVVEIIFKCIRALEYAFQHGIIHRDIKPGNVILSEKGQVKVGDFGASFQQRLEEKTSQIRGVGSPAYMSPEQLRMEALNQQTDIYSLGVTMFRLLTGRLPYEAGSHAGLIYAILNTPEPAPSSVRPELPAMLDQIVLKAIAKDPAKRYKSWLDFGKDVTRAFMTLRQAATQPGEVTTTESEKFGRLRELSFFKDFGEVELWEVVRIGAWQVIDAGTVVVRENEQGDSLYLVIEGELQVSMTDKTVGDLKPGGCFGEILYFAETVERRTTTVTARSRSTVVQLKAAALREASATCQVGFNKAFMRVLIERLAQANRQLAQR